MSAEVFYPFQQSDDLESTVPSTQRQWISLDPALVDPMTGRRKSVDWKNSLAIQESIQRTDRQNSPVAIKLAPAGHKYRYLLVFGLHRLDACIQLKREVLAEIYPDNLQTELCAVEENLARKDITASERKVELAEQARLILAIKASGVSGETRQKLPTGRKDIPTGKPSGRPKGGVTQVARELGVPRETLRDALAATEPSRSGRGGNRKMTTTTQTEAAAEPLVVAHMDQFSNPKTKFRCPEGFIDVEHFAKELLHQVEELGMSQDALARTHKMDTGTAARLVDIACLAARVDLPSAQAAIATQAMNVLKQTNRVGTAYDLVAPVAEYLWGVVKKTKRRVIEEKRQNRFLDAFSALTHTCSAASTIEVPHFNKERTKELVKELEDAISAMKTLHNKLHKVWQHD